MLYRFNISGYVEVEAVNAAEAEKLLFPQQARTFTDSNGPAFCYAVPIGGSGDSVYCECATPKMEADTTDAGIRWTACRNCGKGKP